MSDLPNPPPLADYWRQKFERGPGSNQVKRFPPGG